MFNRTNREIVCAAALLAAVSTLIEPSAAATHPHNGKVHADLVGGSVLSQAAQEQFGLLTLSNPEGTCSASMLNNYWAITAAHCVYSQKNGAAFTASQISLTANWPSNTKTVQAIQIVALSNGTSASGDIALLQTGLYDFVRSDPADWPGSAQALEASVPQAASEVSSYGRGINALAYQSGFFPVPTQIDGKYRTAQFGITNIPPDGSTYDFSGQNGATIAGGDSGGPSFIQEWDDPFSPDRQLVWRLMGVHSRATFNCLARQTCGGAAPNPWQWVSSVITCTDAAVYPYQDIIYQTISQYPQPRQFQGTFGTPPPNSDPIFLYAVQEDGTLLWYRYNAATAIWQGPSAVGWGWDGFTSVFSAGGNNISAITPDGSLLWYRHDGFNDGSFNWEGPNLIGSAWTGFTKVFSGSDGIVYAIQPDGTLLWYRNNNYSDGTANWEGPNVVGSGWADFKYVFSMGQGIVYAVKQDGTLLWYNHLGYQTGDFNWAGPYQVGNGWAQFTSIVPAGNGVIMATQTDGTLLWYKHNNYKYGVPAQWQGGVPVGSGWTGFLQLFAWLPVTPDQPH